MKNKKNRIPIPKGIAAETLYSFDRTCCVCNERGKSIQIHHIDENPANNSIDNLAILCFECHEETQIKGGFGRKLDKEQVLIYKLEWIRRIRERRENADNLASLKTTGNEKPKDYQEEDNSDYFESLDNYWEQFENSKEHEKERLHNYLYKVAEIKATVYKYAQPNWDTGITATMNQASYDVVGFYEEILIELTSFYPCKHFEGEPKDFFSELISIKYKWHRHIQDYFGLGRNGTIVSTIVASIVMAEVDKMIIEMVTELSDKYEFDLSKWIKIWKKVK
jgi:hypothetical protein